MKQHASILLGNITFWVTCLQCKTTETMPYEYLYWYYKYFVFIIYHNRHV